MAGIWSVVAATWNARNLFQHENISRLITDLAPFLSFSSYLPNNWWPKKGDTSAFSGQEII